MNGTVKPRQGAAGDDGSMKRWAGENKWNEKIGSEGERSRARAVEREGRPPGLT